MIRLAASGRGGEVAGRRRLARNPVTFAAITAGTSSKGPHNRRLDADDSRVVPDGERHDGRRPEEQYQPMGHGANRLRMAKSGDEPAIHHSEDGASGFHRGVRGLIEDDACGDCLSSSDGCS
jgi:hypothetical protein